METSTDKLQKDFYSIDEPILLNIIQMLIFYKRAVLYKELQEFFLRYIQALWALLLHKRASRPVPNYRRDSLSVSHELFLFYIELLMASYFYRTVSRTLQWSIKSSQAFLRYQRALIALLMYRWSSRTLLGYIPALGGILLHKIALRVPINIAFAL